MDRERKLEESISVFRPPLVEDLRASQVTPYVEMLYFGGQCLATEVLRLQNLTDGPATGFDPAHESYRYRQIHTVVTQMGGWANFSHWIKEHSVNYFETCEVLKKKIQELERPRTAEELKNLYLAALEQENP